MRVITGTARGRKLEAPLGADITRPTSDMVKEAMFSIIQFEVEGAMVLDLYAGSGQLGIEALSRGAKMCVFVDQNKEAHEVIKTNLTKTELLKSSRVVMMDAKSFLASTKDTFDIVLLDPPYGAEGINEILTLAAAKTADTGVIIYEAAKKTETPEQAGSFIRTKVRKYGAAALSVYKKGTEE